MLELISIHINKTAGKSFRQILSNNYGQSLFCINTDDSDKQHRSLSCRPDELAGMIPSTAKALHGHFTARDISNFVGDTPIIVWLRNPVDRVISNYFHDWNNNYTDLNIEEYVLQNTNKISKMLDGVRFKQLIVGFQENFDQDVIRIGRMFGWKHLTTHKLNVGIKSDVSADILRLIEICNREDIHLYTELKKRNK